ncbi:MAG: hypothetical protein ACKO7W_05695 [Elainella sp.]
MSTEKSPLEQLTDLITSLSAGANQSLVPALQELLERGTETVGQIVTPIAENPLVRSATQVPGVRWLMAALGQVDIAKAEQDVAELRQQYPTETINQLAQRIINDTVMKAAGVGLVTNILPPFALSLFAVDVAAVTALQAEMVYRIAALHGFSVHEPTRRGEVLALWGLSVGGGGMFKAGTSFLEVIPLVGAGIGVATNAALLYSLGFVALQFYEAKLAAQAQKSQSSDTQTSGNGRPSTIEID